MERFMLGMVVFMAILAYLGGFIFAGYMLIFPFTEAAEDVDSSAVWCGIFPLGFILLWFMIMMVCVGIICWKTPDYTLSHPKPMPRLKKRPRP